MFFGQRYATKQPRSLKGEIMNTIDVPIYRQPLTEPYCGPTCVKMVLAYHGQHVPIEKLVQQIGINKAGTDIVNMGMYFSDVLNFRTSVTLWLENFPARFRDLSGAEANKGLLIWSKRRVIKKFTGLEPGDWVYRKSLPRFIRSGGEVVLRPTALEDIKRALELGLPPIVNLNVNVLYRLNRRVAGHYVVPIGIHSDQITYNDPNFDEPQTCSTADFMHACYTRHSAALFVQPR